MRQEHSSALEKVEPEIASTFGIKLDLFRKDVLACCLTALKKHLNSVIPEVLSSPILHLYKIE